MTCILSCPTIEDLELQVAPTYAAAEQQRYALYVRHSAQAPLTLDDTNELKGGV